MKRILVAAAALMISSMGAFADQKPSEEQVAKIKEAIAAWGCTGGEFELEESGVFEVDDAQCKDGQFDFKLDKDFKVISATRD